MQDHTHALTSLEDHPGGRFTGDDEDVFALPKYVLVWDNALRGVHLVRHANYIDEVVDVNDENVRGVCLGNVHWGSSLRGCTLFAF